MHMVRNFVSSCIWDFGTISYQLRVRNSGYKLPALEMEGCRHEVQPLRTEALLLFDTHDVFIHCTRLHVWRYRSGLSELLGGQDLGF